MKKLRTFFLMCITIFAAYSLYALYTVEIPGDMEKFEEARDEDRLPNFERQPCYYLQQGYVKKEVVDGYNWPQGTSNYVRELNQTCEIHCNKKGMKASSIACSAKQESYCKCK